MTTNRDAATGSVVVGVHHSLGAYQALRYAVAEAGRRDATLLVVHALRRPAGRGASAPTVDAGLEYVRSVFVEALGAMPTGPRLKVVAEYGNPGAVLVGFAHREHDLLVIGGSSRHRLRRAGVAAYCARHAGCPVLIVPPPALARAGRTGRLARTAVHDLERHLATTGRRPGAHVRRRSPRAA
jgi:nucleotide-binding universal stress UspA family protein